MVFFLCNQEHKDFYDSIFSLAKTPRSLQHLARCKLRSYLEGRVYKVVPKLDLPNFIKDYLLLECRGYVHWTHVVVLVKVHWWVQTSQRIFLFFFYVSVSNEILFNPCPWGSSCCLFFIITCKADQLLQHIHWCFNTTRGSYRTELIQQEMDLAFYFLCCIFGFILHLKIKRITFCDCIHYTLMIWLVNWVFS